MAKFQKKILKTGNYQSPDGPLPVTSDRLKHWSETFNAMHGNNLGIPIGWDHDDDPKKAVPIQLGPNGRKRRAKDVVGYVDKISVSESGDSVDLVIDVPRKEDADKVANNLAYVSPIVFRKFKDGQGTEYDDCITRVDLVQHPVDNSQTEFEAVATACALRMGLEDGKPALYRLAEEMEEEDSDEPEKDETAERIKSVISALAAVDIVIQADTTAENFFERVEAALLTAKAMQDDADDLNEARPGEVAALSLEGNDMSEQKTDAPEMTVHEKYANQQHQKDVVRRLGLLLETGRCAPAEHEASQELAKTIRLSLTADGEFAQTDLESWIESRESIPAGTFWSNEQRLSQLTEAAQPAGMNTEVTEEEATKIVDELLGSKS